MISSQPCDKGVMLGGRASAPCSKAAHPWVLAATILGSSLAFIDGTIVNVALPALQRELGATVSDVQWVVEAYALFLSALLLIGGAMGDRFGRRRVYAIGVALFAAASAACGLAANVRMLVIARGVQGVGGALLVPGSLALISATFPKQERGRAIGTWSSFSAITAALGPVAGGWLIEHLSWRWAFFVNVPIAAAVLWMLVTRVPESRDASATGRVDWPGGTTLTLALGGIVYGLIEAPRLGWGHPSIVLALALGLAALAAFITIEARSRAPMMPLALFRSRNFAGANLLTLLLYAALACALFLLPLNLIQVHGYSATQAGATFLPFIVIMFVFSRWSGALADRVGAKLPLTVGPLIAAAGFALMAVPGTEGTYWTTFFPAVVVLGIGMTLTVAPLTTTVMNAVDSSHAGLASGINNAVSRTAGLLGVAVVGLVVVHVYGKVLVERLAHESIRPAIVAEVLAEREKLAAATPPSDSTPAERAVMPRIVAEAFVAGFRAMALIAAGLAAAGAVAAFVLIEGKSGAAGSPPNRESDSRA